MTLKHTGRKHCLLDGRYTPAYLDLENTSGYRWEKTKYELAIVFQQKRWAECPLSLFSWERRRRWDWHSPTRFGEGGEGVVLELLGGQSLQVEKRVWHLQRGHPTRSQRTWATGCFSRHFGRNGSTRLWHCSGHTDPLVGSGLWFLTTCSVKGAQEMTQKPRTMGDITETDGHLCSFLTLEHKICSL